MKNSEAGIGLIEIVISMFLIALIAMAFLPLLIRTMATSTLNTSTSSASQLVAAGLDEVRTIAPTCTAVTSFTGAVVPTITDERGVALLPHRELASACPAGYPGTVSVRVWVTEVAKTAVLAEATTLVYLSAAN